MKTTDELWDIQQVADFLKISRSTAYKIWPQWTKNGIVKPVRWKDQSRLLFKKSEIMKLVDSWQIIHN